MSTSGDASASQNSSHNFSLLSIMSKVTLDGTNYNDWMWNIKMTLSYEGGEYIIEKQLVKIGEATATPE